VQTDARRVRRGRRRPGRRARILAWTGGVTAGVVLLAATGGYFVYRHLSNNIDQIDISGMLGRNQPADPHPQAENIVVVGSDTRSGQGSGFGRGLTTDQSDTLMIVHISASRKWADIMSVPRDSWVGIPACVMGNGQTSAPTTFKINEAFALGNLDGNHTSLGTACTIKTLEADTGIHIDHFVAINFEGFRDMVNALGGVEECNTTPISDPNSGLYLSAGHHLLNGTQALGYVRARYTLGNGSDLERIGRQQAFMASLVSRVKSELLDPVAIYNFLDAATKSVTIDTGLGGLGGLYGLASSLKNMRRSQVTFFTVPTYPRALVVATDDANVMWTQPEASLIFQAFQDDVPVSKALFEPPKPPALAPGTISVDVLNGTQQAGLEDTVSSVLQQDGFRAVPATINPISQNEIETVIEYPPALAAAAKLVASKVPGAGLQQVSGGTEAVTLVLGSNYGTTVYATSPAEPAPAPQPVANYKPRTANQDICT
jgi:LCP family protein required for cell wall assembly